jgi:hypothetical protein
MLLRTTGEPITDENLTELLGGLGDVLSTNYHASTHFVAIYDLRKPKMPPFSESYAKVKLLAAWCRTQTDLATKVSFIDTTIHSIAVILPRGTKLLKNCLNFFLWICKPPMELLIVEEDMPAARAFLDERQEKYRGGELNLKPIASPIAAGSKPTQMSCLPRNIKALSAIQEEDDDGGGAGGGDDDDDAPVEVAAIIDT